jgi:hypothetical protein
MYKSGQIIRQYSGRREEELFIILEDVAYYDYARCKLLKPFGNYEAGRIYRFTIYHGAEVIDNTPLNNILYGVGP